MLAEFPCVVLGRETDDVRYEWMKVLVNSVLCPLVGVVALAPLTGKNSGLARTEVYESLRGGGARLGPQVRLGGLMV